MHKCNDYRREVQLQKLHRFKFVQVSLVVAFLALCVCCFPVRGQVSELSVLALELNDELVRSDPQKIRFLIEEIIDTKGPEITTFDKAVVHRLAGTYFQKSGKVNKGISHLRLALQYFVLKEDYSLASRISNDIGNACQIAGYQERSEYYYLLSQELAKDSPDPEDEYINLYNYGRLKLIQGDTTAALSMFDAYRDKVSELGKNESLADVYSMYFMVYNSEGKQDSALFCLNKAILYARLSDSRLAESNALINSAIFHYSEGELEVSLKQFREGLNVRKLMGNKHLECDALFNLGEYYWGVENIDSAQFYYDQALCLALENDLFQDAKDALSALLKLPLKEKDKLAFMEEKNAIASLLSQQQEKEILLFSDVKQEAKASLWWLTALFLIASLLAVITGLMKMVN